MGRIDEFLAWAEATARVTRLWNPAPLVRWNSDKSYLLDLAGRGVPVVPTRCIAPGDSYGEEDFEGMHGVVVKPSVSAGARDTARYEPGRGADAERHARVLLGEGRTVMVQPYLPLVEEGERALGGPATEAELRAALAAVPSPDEPLFARVDLVLDEAREPVLIELELIERNLFLGLDPRGADRLALAVAAAAREA
ncbi:hypothetical protein ACFCX3_22320 [Streptomyces virginiae]|uniref:hypothetical protein n=1 Tax=Streptomyces virginiae TaxID=1961 RepID=UPI0035D72E11